MSAPDSSRKTIRGLDRIQQPSDLLTARHDGEFSRSFRSLELSEVTERSADDMFEVEGERVERLSLRRGRHPVHDHQALEESPHCVGILLQATVTAKCEESIHPECIRLFGTNRVSTAPDRVS